MAFNPNQALLGKHGQAGGNQDYQQSSANYMQSAQSAMGGQMPVREGDPGPSVGGALGAGMAGGLGVAGIQAATAVGTTSLFSAAGGGAAAGTLGGPMGIAIGAGIGILSYMLS